MKRVFADTSYWVAILRDNDQWHEIAILVINELGKTEIITTESVLIEVLNYFSEYKSDIKDFVANYVEEILKDDETLVLLHNHDDFLKALELYKSRLDKGYSLTDCVSMNSMREIGISEVLTNDQHFEQEGFTKLF